MKRDDCEQKFKLAVVSDVGENISSLERILEKGMDEIAVGITSSSPAASALNVHHSFYFATDCAHWGDGPSLEGVPKESCLQSPQSKTLSEQMYQLELVADILRNCPEVTYTVRGYASSQGKLESNKELAINRAEFIQKRLSKLVDSDAHLFNVRGPWAYVARPIGSEDGGAMGGTLDVGSNGEAILQAAFVNQRASLEIETPTLGCKVLPSISAEVAQTFPVE